MIPITILSEHWDDQKQEFVYVKEQTLRFEHSLVSLSKWESKWHKPFFGKEQKTPEEKIYYLKCMTLNQNVDPEIYNFLTSENIKDIDAYIADPMTATVFSKANGGGHSTEFITAEIIYYSMVTLGIPFECEKWHLKRLLNLIEVCNRKNAPKQKRSQKEIASRNAALNAARKKQLNTRG